MKLAVALFAIDSTVPISKDGMYFIPIDHLSVNGGTLALFLVID